MDLTFSRYTKSRIAPTPSGFLHLGNVLSFSITAYLAKKTGAKILLRIDDLDQARVNNAYLADVYACACSRSELNKPSFKCPCKSKNIPLESKEVTWRLYTQDAASIFLTDISGNYQSFTLPAEMTNFIVRKKDGFPAYQLTSVVDDLFYGVDLIVRGEDLLPSTLAQQVLAKALGKSTFSEIAFYHHPLLKSAEGEKLSKSAGATSVQYLRQQGFKLEDIYQSIASMAGIKTKVANYEQLAEKITAL